MYIFWYRFSVQLHFQHLSVVYKTSRKIPVSYHFLLRQSNEMTPCSSGCHFTPVGQGKKITRGSSIMFFFFLFTSEQRSAKSFCTVMKDRSVSLILSPGCEPKPFWVQDTGVCVYYVRKEVINYTVILVLVSQDQSLFQVINP